MITRVLTFIMAIGNMIAACVIASKNDWSGDWKFPMALAIFWAVMRIGEKIQ